MQQFVIPQFIDIEDQIIGPITTRQFIILLATAFLMFVSYKLSDFTLFLTLAVPLGIIGLTLAFVRVNGRPFHFFLLNLLQTFGRPALRVWNKRAVSDPFPKSAPPAAVPTVVVKRPPLGSSRLSELALIVDTGGVYRGE